MRKFGVLFLVAVIVITFVFSSVAFAGSYDSVPVIFAGWSLSPNTTYSNLLLNTKTIGGLDNLDSSIAASYFFNSTITQSILLGGTLGGELSSTINVESGTVSGGLGSKINASINIQATYTGSYTEQYGPVTVPAHKKLTLKSKIYGTKVSGYAKYFIAWIESQRGTYIVKIPEYQMFYPVWTP
jgi:hypothetical protein